MNERISTYSDIISLRPLEVNINIAQETYQIINKFDKKLHEEGKSVENSEITEEVAIAVDKLRDLLTFKQITGELPKKTVKSSRRYIERYSAKADELLNNFVAKS